MKVNLNEIDIDKLKEIKNLNEPISYSNLCKKLNIEYLHSNSKKAQLKQLSTYCKLEKVDTKYKIVEVYKEPKELTDNRMKTLPKIEIILMSELSQINGSLFTTNKELLKLCYIINNNYYNILSNKDKNSLIIAKKYNFDESFLEYIDKTYDILKPTLLSALNSMKRKKEIDITTGYKITRKDGSIMCVTSAPTDEIGKRIFEIQGNVMAEMDMTSLRECYVRKKGIYSKNKLKEYYDNCNKKLQEECITNENWIKNGWTDFTAFYQCYAITLNQKKIKYDLERELRTRSDLNELIKNKLHETKRLRDLSYNEIDKWFFVFNTTKGDVDYDFEEDIKQYYRMLGKEKK